MTGTEIVFDKKEKLLSEETFKILVAKAWEKNEVKEDRFLRLLGEMLEKIHEIYGAPFATEVSGTMQNFWMLYQKKQKEAAKAAFSSSKGRVKCKNGIFYMEDGKEKVEIVSAARLSTEKLPPVYYAVENMIPEGETVISAPFKSGKSWFVMQMCIAVARGEPFLGFRTSRGAAIYFALEDCDKFAQERLNILPGDVPENFYYIFEAHTLDNGLLEMLDRICEQVENVRMIVIDTLAFVEYQPKRGESAYKCDYRTGSALKKWADGKGIAIVVVTHTTKMQHTDDPFMNTAGTNGVTAAADSLLTIVKEKRTDKIATLAVTGRRVRESFHKIQMDDNCVWQNLGTLMDGDGEAAKLAEEKRIFEESEIRKAVLTIADHGDFRGKAKDLKDAAQELGIYLLEDAKEIGGFLHRYQTWFIRFENVKVTIINNGNAPKIYKLQVWKQINENNNIFDT